MSESKKSGVFVSGARMLVGPPPVIDLIVATVARLDCAPVVSPRARLERSSEMGKRGRSPSSTTRARTETRTETRTIHRRIVHCVDCEEGAVAMRETTAAYHARAAMRERGGAPVTVRVGTVETLGPVVYKGATSREIALSKLDWMCDLVSRAREEGDDDGTVDELIEGLGGEPDYVVVDFECLEVEALRGFPGPCVGYMLDVLGPSGVWDVVSRHADRSARHVVLLMAKNVRTGNVEIFESAASGEVVPPENDAARSDGVRTIFKPNNCHRPVATFSHEVRLELSPRRDAHAQFLAFLDKEEGGAKEAEEDCSADVYEFKEPEIEVDTDETSFGMEAHVDGRQKSRSTTSRGKDEGRECRPTKTQETGKKGSADSEYAGKSMRIAESLHRKLLAERDAWANVLRALKDYSDEERAGVIA